VSDHQASYPIVTMCKLLGVSSSGYYAWVKRRPSRRLETDAALITEIRAAHGTYGAPRVHAELAAKGTYIGRKRVARLMTQAGLVGVSRRKFVVTTVKDDSRQAPDLVERNFVAEAPDLLWVSCFGRRPACLSDGDINNGETGRPWLPRMNCAYGRRQSGGGPE
jgi:putative transposase